MRNPLLVLSILALSASAGSAQSAPSYRLHIGDTLRFAERTEMVVHAGGPEGQIEIRLDHVATLGVARSSSTEAHGWFDSLHLRQVGPMGQQSEPDTRALIGQPYLLDFPEDGRVRLVTSPKIPDEIAATSDLSREFDDFFITLPSRVLAMGVEWADTMTVERAEPSTDSFRVHQIRRYRVTRDTMFGQLAAFVISVQEESRIEGSGPLPDMPQLTAHTVLDGNDSGFVVFSPSTGELLFRTRTGRYSGELTISGGPQPVVLPQTFEYTHTIESVR